MIRLTDLVLVQMVYDSTAPGMLSALLGSLLGPQLSIHPFPGLEHFPVSTPMILKENFLQY